jgi:hypothetical protein
MYNLPQTVWLLVPIHLNTVRYARLYLICDVNICIFCDERQYYYNKLYFKQTVSVMKKAEFSKQ